MSPRRTAQDEPETRLRVNAQPHRPSRVSVALVGASAILAAAVSLAVALPPPAASRAPSEPRRPVIVMLPTEPAPTAAPSPSAVASAVPVRRTPAASAKPKPVKTPRPKSKPKAGRSLVAGSATWYAYRPGEAAAGPALRAALGEDWRGSFVTVTAANGNRVIVRLTDWCLCGHGRVVDLDARAFNALGPLSRGVLRVTVSR